MRSRFAEIPFCYSFTILPAPSLVLLNYVLQAILRLSVQYMSSFDLVICPANQVGIVTKPETGIKCKVKQDGYQAE